MLVIGDSNRIFFVISNNIERGEYVTNLHI